MGKTFEALLRAEREKEGKLEQVKAEKMSAALPEDCNLRSQVAEEYRRLKYRIVKMDPERKIRSILFVSPTGGEGNSTVLAHFATVLACEGDRVLVVDTNLRRPSIHRIFNVELKNGFSEFILQESSLESVMKGTSFRNLQIVTSGDIHSDPFAVISLKSLDSCIARLKLKADWVLFDSPSIDSYNDALALAPRLDGVVLVIQAETTRWEVAMSARQRMEASNARILGVVLNKRRFYIPEWLYKRL